MNTLLVFFALPLATIILAGIFETFINSPIKVAGIAFAIYLIVAFALGGTIDLVVAAIVYTIIALITALIVNCFINRQDEDDDNDFPSCNCRNRRR